jgi:predicted alpha/beta superfamily hydrolase
MALLDHNQITAGTRDWRDYRTEKGESPHTVVGNLRVLPQLWSPQLRNRRDILVYLPPSYQATIRRYPVLYMHDGQNLFDAATSYVGEWEVDETMESLSYSEGLEAIVVGIPNMGQERLAEYSPFTDHHHTSRGGRGERYVNFLAETLKPIIDKDFRTRPERECTGIMGSSMGGLISLYAMFSCPEVYGFAGVMSPSFWFAQSAIFNYIEQAPFISGKIYLDAGTRELSGPMDDRIQRARSRRYYASIRRMYRLLAKKGYRPQRDLLYIEEKWATHSESSWGRRLPLALRFFLKEESGPMIA